MRFMQTGLSGTKFWAMAKSVFPALAAADARVAALLWPAMHSLAATEPNEVALVSLLSARSASFVCGPQFARSSDDDPTLLTGDGAGIPGRDTFYFSAMSGFTIPWVAGDHAVIIQEMKVSFSGILSAS